MDVYSLLSPMCFPIANWNSGGKVCCRTDHHVGRVIDYGDGIIPGGGKHKDCPWKGITEEVRFEERATGTKCTVVGVNVNTRPVLEERGHSGVVFYTITFRELRDIRINQSVAWGEEEPTHS